jgi:hypothetical protein
MSLEILICATVIIYMLIFLKVLTTFLSGFDPGRAEEIYKNKELFIGGKQTYDIAKNKMQWMDPVIYYDTIKLAKAKKMSIDSLKQMLV